MHITKNSFIYSHYDTPSLFLYKRMTRTKLLIISMSTARSLHLQSKIQPETHSAPNSSSENNPYWYSSELTVRIANRFCRL